MARRGKAIGIDFGTSYTCVGVWRTCKRTVEIVPNEHGNRTTPSVVGFGAAECLVGQSAVNQLSSNPSNTVFDAKRLIGRRATDSAVHSDSSLWPFRLTSDHKNRPLITVHFKGEQKTFSAEDIAALVLLKVRDVAETHLGAPVEKAVISVPACFTDAQRRAIRHAGKIAGLDVLQIVNEPMAAAVAYALQTRAVLMQSKNEETVLCFDLGGGSFDVAVVQIRRKRIILLAVGGDPRLGGEDFTKRMVGHFVKDFKRRHDIDLSDDTRALRRLHCACEKAKRDLSFSAETLVEVPSLCAGEDLHATLRRSKFEQLNADLFERCMAILRRCMADAGVTRKDVRKVVLVGGSTRIPKIQEMLKDFFDCNNLCKTVHPDEAVAFGTAVQAAVRNRDYDGVNFTVKNVSPFTVGIGVRSNLMSVIVPRNACIPTKAEFDFWARRDGHRGMSINVYESQDAFGRGSANCVGGFRLSALQPPSDNGMVCVGIRLEIDTDGLLTVSAEDKTLPGCRDELEFCSGESREWSAAVESLKNEDRVRKETVALRNELELLIFEVKKKAYRLAESVNLVGELDAAGQWFSENPNASKEEITAKIKQVNGLLLKEVLREDSEEAAEC